MPARRALDDPQNPGVLHPRPLAADQRGRARHLRSGHAGALQVGEVVRALKACPAVAARRGATDRATRLDRGYVVGEGREDPAVGAELACVRSGSVRGQRDPRATAGLEPGAAIVVSRRRDHQPLARAQPVAGAVRLQVRGRRSLVVRVVVGRRRHQDDIVPVRVVERAIDDGRGARAAEAHVDHVGAVVGGVCDRPGDQRVIEVLGVGCLLDDQLAPEGGPCHSDAVAASRAGEARHVSTVPHLVVPWPSAGRLHGAAATGVVVALRVGDPPRQVEVPPVDSGVDDGELRAPSARAPPGPPKALLAQVPLVEVVRGSTGVASPQGGIVGQVAKGPVALQLDPADRGVGVELTASSRKALSGSRPHDHRAELGERADAGVPAAVQHGGDATLGRIKDRLARRLPGGRRDPRRSHQGDQVAGSPGAVGGRRSAGNPIGRRRGVRDWRNRQGEDHGTEDEPRDSQPAHARTLERASDWPRSGRGVGRTGRNPRAQAYHLRIRVKAASAGEGETA